MEKNRINFAKLQILGYVEEIFTQISDLMHLEIEGLMHAPSHGLSREELIVVLHDMFTQHILVAKTLTRGLFTPTLAEIESAFAETRGHGIDSRNFTFYGLTTAAAFVRTELQNLYEVKKS